MNRALYSRIVAYRYCVVLYLAASAVESKSSTRHELPGSLCGNSPKQIDGALLTSSHRPLYADSACVMKFVADDDNHSHGRFMMKFNHVNITDCSVSLKAYFGPAAYGHPDLELTCNTISTHVMYTNSGFLTLRLDKRTLTGYDFEIVITTYQNKIFCGDFKCRNEKCIDDDLKCDGVDNCFDNSDEESCHGHFRTKSSQWTGTQNAWFSFIGIVVFILLTVAGVLFRYFRYGRLPRFGFGTGRTTAVQMISLQEPLNPPAQPVVVTTAPFPPNYYAGAQPQPPASYPQQPMQDASGAKYYPVQQYPVSPAVPYQPHQAAVQNPPYQPQQAPFSYLPYQPDQAPAPYPPSEPPQAPAACPAYETAAAYPSYQGPPATTDK